MAIRAYGHSHRGLTRKTNEDSYLIEPDLGLYIVCDGLGGHSAGEVASSKAIEWVAAAIRRERELLESKPSAEKYDKLGALAQAAIQDTCRRLHELAASRPEYAGMATTVTVLVALDDRGNRGLLAHVGDCRLYVLRQRKVELLTVDHTIEGEMIRAGVLEDESAGRSRFANTLTRAVGSQDSVPVDTILFDLLPGDRCLLCSDGLSRYLSDAEAISGYLEAEDLAEVPGRLIDFAVGEGGQDNITVIVLEVEE